MKAKGLILVLLMLGLALLACTRSLTGVTSQQATPTAIVVASNTTAPEASATQATEQPSATTEAAATEASATETPTATQTNTPTASPTLGAGTPSVTPTTLAFDPNSAYGSPTVFDSMDNGKYWQDNNGNLPNTSYIKLEIDSGQMLVTGKLAAFDTWWFTYLSAADLFIQMQVETGSCSGKQSYGLILHGPSSGDFARGYLLHFSCDGYYRLERLDNTNPYKTEDIISWKASDEINKGDDQTNTLGVHFEGDTITIYANGVQIDQVDDHNYLSGRFGIFVNGGGSGNYTFKINEISFWNLD